MVESEKIYLEALSEIEKDSPDVKKTLNLLFKAFDLGDFNAAYALGSWYLHGNHVEKNLSKAMVYLEFAADNNVSSALYDLAICYEKGVGVGEDKEQAFKLYLKAALLGDNQSIYEVGRCYYYGLGVTEDKDLSDVWLEIAELKGIEC